jgi:hypothetical protein
VFKCVVVRLPIARLPRLLWNNYRNNIKGMFGGEGDGPELTIVQESSVESSGMTKDNMMAGA